LTFTSLHAFGSIQLLVRECPPRSEEVAVRRSSKPTLSDVAARAGVSATTASYILNGRTLEMRISSDTEERVRRAASELAYRPNRIARNLRTASTATIGMISDLIAGGHVASNLLTGASEAARELDHLVVIGESGGLPDVESRFIEEMLGRQVDGIVYATLAARAVTVPAELVGQRVVLLNCVDPSAEIPSVMPDDVMGGRVAAQALLDAGCADGIFVVGEDPSDTVVAGPARLAGVHDALEESGAGLAGVVPCYWDVTTAYDAVSAWLGNGHRPRGLICLNDRVAMGAYQALAERGLRVPDDVAVVSFDGSELATWLRPRLASVALPFAAMGRRAVEILLDPSYEGPRDVRMPMTLQPGGSLPGRGARTGEARG
jgi:LacI family transcriptional regulator